MKKLMKKLILLLLATISLGYGYAQTPTNLSVDIIPKPSELTSKPGYFGLNENTLLVIDKSFKSNKDYIISEIKKSTSLTIKSKKSDLTTNKLIILKSDKQMGDDDYNLKIDADNIIIEASKQGGVINALTSLNQLILVNNTRIGSRVIYVPAVEIKDSPVFAWRGFMIDVSRHFFNMEQVREIVDQMAFLKLNILHLHLSDDQGYRMESKKFPKLNTIGSWRVDHNCTSEEKNAFWAKPVQEKGDHANYGGYYTQKELKELVKYAKQRNIEILPEIDVPGHSQAIIAAYPEATCFSDREYYVATGGVRGNNTVCPTQDFSYELIEGIIEELTEVFPFEYIHIGGDECDKGLWSKHKKCQDFIKENNMKDEGELQSYFIRRVEELVNAKGKKMIGWDEILEGGIAPNATVMSWRGEQGGIAAIKMGHDVVMSPNSYNYLDLKQGQSIFEPNLGYSKVLLSTTYNSSVIPTELTEEEAKHILGNQANQWGESLSDFSKYNYMTYPRLFAVAENCWTSEKDQQWDGFIKRLRSMLTIFDKDGIRYAKSVFNPWLHHKGDSDKIKIWFTSELTSPEIRYTTDGETPLATSTMFTDTIVLDKTTVIKSAIFENGKRLGNVIERKFYVHKGVNALVRVGDEGEFTKNHKLVDLNHGEFLEDGDKAWIHIDKPTNIHILLTKPTNISQLIINTPKMTLGGTYSMDKIEVFAKVEGKEVKVMEKDLSANTIEQGRNIIVNNIPCKIDNATSLRIKVYNVKSIAKGHFSEGKSSTMNIDEIIIL